MPSKDPITGKFLSGAALRRKKKVTSTVAIANQKARTVTTIAGGLSFTDLPAPPLGDPLAAMAWWNDVLLTCADQILRDPHITLEARVRFLADFSAKAGMIRDKAAESRAIRTALAAKENTAASTGLEKVSGPTPSKIPKPPI